MPEPLGNTSLLFIIAFVALILGYVFGWLTSLYSRRQEEKAALAAGVPAETSAAGEAVEATVEGSDADLNRAVAPPPPAPAEKAILAFRKGKKGLSLELNGKVFTDPEEFNDDDRLLVDGALNNVAAWVGLPAIKKEPQPAAPAKMPEPRSAQPAPPVIPAVPAQPRVVGGMTGVIADALSPAQARKPDAHLSIVQQIDEILQEMLVTSELAGQTIVISEDPRKGVLVRVNNDVYEGVGALPEGAVKRLLQSAVAEWERRQEARRRQY